ncbi:cytochrome P450 [bacterium]|nr:cytochrome P450 [bacterium]
MPDTLPHDLNAGANASPAGGPEARNATDAAKGEPRRLFRADTIAPPETPLPFVRGLLTMVDNPIKVWPKSAYRDRYHKLHWMGRTAHYIRSPEHVKAVLLDHADAFEKSEFQTRLLKPATGEGLLTSEGEHWRFQRRAASPAFRYDALKALVPTFARAASEAVGRMRAEGGGAPIDVMNEMNRTTLDVIVETIMSSGDPGFRHEHVSSAVTDYVQTLGHPDLLDILGAPPWIPRLKGSKGARAAARLKAAAVDSIARRRASDETRSDLLSLLMAARDPETGRGLSETELRDNIVTFIGAGHETTALALTYTLYLIANDPVVQDRLHAEAVEVCGDAPVDADMVERLTFHEQVVKEAMRLYPPVALMDRRAVRDVEDGDLKIEAGDLVLIMIYVMHRHQRIWDQPEMFDPERFSPERSAGRHRFAYIPFGGGQRICIGMKFAYMEAAAILATLVRDLRFSPNPAHRVRPNIRITLRPAGGMPLFVSPR